MLETRRQSVPRLQGYGSGKMLYFICHHRGVLNIGINQVVANDCTQFEERLNRNGELRAVPLPELAFTITGLASDTPYEFKVAAVSDLGEGEWSDVSLPLVLPNAPNAPAQLPARHLLDVMGVLEQSERLRMKENDVDVEHILSSAGHTSETQLTPRLLDGRKNTEISTGRLLPTSVNPRDGWRAGLKGGANLAMEHELNSKEALEKTILRTRDGKYLPSVSETPSGKLGDLRLPLEYFVFNTDIKALEWSDTEDEDQQGDDNGDDISLENGSKLGVEETQAEVAAVAKQDSTATSSKISSKSRKTPTLADRAAASMKATGPLFENAGRDALLSSKLAGDDYSDFGDSAVEEETIVSNTTLETAEQERLVIPIDDARKALNDTVDDDVIIDCRSIVGNLGRPNPRQLHNLRLRSTYEYYSSGGEPSFTTSRPSDFGACACDCVDYLMYSAASFTARTMLLLPPLGELNGGQDIRETITTTSSFLYRPLPFFATVYDRHVRLLDDSAVHTGVGKLAHDTSFSNGRNSATKRVSSAVSKSPISSGRKSSAFRLNSATRKSMTQPSSMHRQPFTINTNDFKNRLRDALDQSILASSLVKNKYWGGVYLPDSMANPVRKQFWLPNDTFASSHFCLGVELVLNRDYTSTSWST
jgi:hypothetical protein